MNVHSKDDRCDVSMAPNEEPMMRPGDHFPVNLRPVLEDVPWDNEDEMPSVSTTCYIDRDSIRLPLHLHIPAPTYRTGTPSKSNQYTDFMPNMQIGVKGQSW